MPTASRRLGSAETDRDDVHRGVPTITKAGTERHRLSQITGLSYKIEVGTNLSPDRSNGCGGADRAL
jgi:hypothetical protein